MTYACLTWEFAADSHLLKLQRLQNKVLGTIGKLPRRIPTRDLHVAYIYDCYTTMQEAGRSHTKS
jgi:hypothetical protein